MASDRWKTVLFGSTPWSVAAHFIIASALVVDAIWWRTVPVPVLYVMAVALYVVTGLDDLRTYYRERLRRGE